LASRDGAAAAEEFNMSGEDAGIASLTELERLITCKIAG
jgi:hypothetical protein